MGISKFSKVATSRAKEYEGTYYGKPSNAENLVFKDLYWNLVSSSK